MRQIESWQRIAALHRALCGQDDLASTLQAFSEWLRPYVPHLLVGLLGVQDDAGQRVLVRATSRRIPALKEVARQFKGRAGPGTCREIIRAQGFVGLLWPAPIRPGLDRMLIVRNEEPSTVETDILDAATAELMGPLGRAARFEQVLEEARHDPLTGLANRRAFEEAVRRAHRRAATTANPAVLMSGDLDNFKALNDRLGHPTGDRALVEVARALTDGVRATDTVARLGGDEFNIILPDTDALVAERLAGRLGARVDELARTFATEVPFGLSLGIAAWRQGETPEQWYQRADQALYLVKRARQGIVCHQATPLALHAAED